jgi:hypothetical protein
MLAQNVVTCRRDIAYVMSSASDWSKKFSLIVLDRPGSGARGRLATEGAAIPAEVGDANRGLLRNYELP